MSTAVVAVFVAVGIIVALDYLTFRRALAVDLDTTAQLVAANSAAALMFDDRTSAAETLRAVAFKPIVSQACVYDADGNVVAAYAREAKSIAVDARPCDEHAAIHRRPARRREADSAWPRAGGGPVTGGIRSSRAAEPLPLVWCGRYGRTPGLLRRDVRFVLAPPGSDLGSRFNRSRRSPGG